MVSQMSAGACPLLSSPSLSKFTSSIPSAFSLVRALYSHGAANFMVLLKSTGHLKWRMRGLTFKVRYLEERKIREEEKTWKSTQSDINVLPDT